MSETARQQARKLAQRWWDERKISYNWTTNDEVELTAIFDEIETLRQTVGALHRDLAANRYTLQMQQEQIDHKDRSFLQLGDTAGRAELARDAWKQRALLAEAKLARLIEDG